MAKNHGDVTLILRLKDGRQEFQAIGASEDLIPAAAYVACRVCALVAKTPDAADKARQGLVESLIFVGTGAVQGMFMEKLAAEDREKTRPKAPSRTPMTVDTIQQERCPACGGTVKLWTKKVRGNTRYRLECHGDCWFGTGWNRTLQGAVDEWNQEREEWEEEHCYAAE